MLGGLVCGDGGYVLLEDLRGSELGFFGILFIVLKI